MCFTFAIAIAIFMEKIRDIIFGARSVVGNNTDRIFMGFLNKKLLP